jgi:hypothetical protein
MRRVACTIRFYHMLVGLGGPKKWEVSEDQIALVSFISVWRLPPPRVART